MLTPVDIKNTLYFLSKSTLTGQEALTYALLCQKLEQMAQENEPKEEKKAEVKKAK